MTEIAIAGAGVAGLQAIATAKRLGAQVWATDVRIAVKEQVESLGAKFIDVPGMEDLEDERGYAKEATPEFLEKQRQEVAKRVAEADLEVLIPKLEDEPPPPPLTVVPAVAELSSAFGSAAPEVTVAA